MGWGVGGGATVLVKRWQSYTVSVRLELVQKQIHLPRVSLVKSEKGGITTLYQSG